MGQEKLDNKWQKPYVEKCLPFLYTSTGKVLESGFVLTSSSFRCTEDRNFLLCSGHYVIYFCVKYVLQCIFT